MHIDAQLDIDLVAVEEDETVTVMLELHRTAGRRHRRSPAARCHRGAGPQWFDGRPSHRRDADCTSRKLSSERTKKSREYRDRQHGGEWEST